MVQLGHQQLHDEPVLSPPASRPLVGAAGSVRQRHVGSLFVSGGALADDLPFDELRSRSEIRELALAAGDGDDFSQKIRAGLVQPRS